MFTYSEFEGRCWELKIIFCVLDYCLSSFRYDITYNLKDFIQLLSKKKICFILHLIIFVKIFYYYVFFFGLYILYCNILYIYIHMYVCVCFYGITVKWIDGIIATYSTAHGHPNHQRHWNMMKNIKMTVWHKTWTMAIVENIISFIVVHYNWV